MSTPRDWKYLIGRSCQFDHPGLGKRVGGVIIEAVDNGLTERGAIPDARVTIRGASGATVTVSLVEQHVQFSTP